MRKESRKTIALLVLLLVPLVVCGQKNIALFLENDSIRQSGPRSPFMVPTATLDSAILTFSFANATASQVIIISQASGQAVYSNAFDSSAQISIGISDICFSDESYLIRLNAFGKWWRGEFVMEEYEENPQGNEEITSLFSIDLNDVVSMYYDENAEAFCLHTKTSDFDGTKYTVSKEGEILSEEPSKLMWAYWEDGVKYTHVWRDKFFLDEKGDTVVKEVYRDVTLAQPMCRKDGVLYWWYGCLGSSSKVNSIFSFKDGDERPVYRRTLAFHCTGLVALDNTLICTCTTYHSEERNCYYYIYFTDDPKDWKYQHQERRELPGVKDPVGLSLVGETFYIWSNETKTMYTIPKSYFVGAAEGFTGVQVPVADAESSERFYDLQGRPVDGTQRGILIRNGKKMLVK